MHTLMASTPLRKIKFGDLPLSVQHQITPILQHRKDTRITTAAFAFINTAALGRAFLPSTPKPDVVAHVLAEAVVLGASLKALHHHNEPFELEKKGVFHALRTTDDPNIKTLLTQFPFVIVARNGDLIGKRFNPRIGFVPIGRRRIPTRERPAKTLRRKLRK